MSRSVEEIEAARAERKAKLAAAKAEQFAADLEALDALELEHGDDKVRRVDLNAWAPGVPTFVVVRMPSPIEFRRYQDQVKTQGNGKPGDVVRATHAVADACIVYPDADTYKRVREASPGVHVIAGTTAVDMCAAKAAEEGKD